MLELLRRGRDGMRCLRSRDAEVCGAGGRKGWACAACKIDRIGPCVVRHAQHRISAMGSRPLKQSRTWRGCSRVSPLTYRSAVWPNPDFAIALTPELISVNISQ